MKSINIMLTKEQHELLRDLFCKVRKAYNDGNPTSLFAQIWESRDKKHAWMDARCLEPDIIEKIQALNIVPIGTMPPPGNRVDVIIPETEKKGE